jgi:exodeoxyribonuclease V gamma subunit
MRDPQPAGLTVHRAASGGALATGLAELLAEPADDPFAVEVVAVPAKGVERWLAQRLAHTLGGGSQSDGVCANIEFPWPSTVLDDAVSSVSPEHATAVERWAAPRARWALVEVIDASLAEPWCRSLAHHLGPTPEQDKGRRLAVATRLARSFDEYGRSRPQMLRAWAAGRNESGQGRPLDGDLHGQAELWRRLRDRLGTPAPAELLDDACARLRAQPELAALPGRLSVFGVSRLSPADLSVLAALAEHRQVHLWLHHASPALWDAGERAGQAGEQGLLRADDPTRRALRNPLLASMSRDLLELQHLLHRWTPGAHSVLHLDPAPRPTRPDEQSQPAVVPNPPAERPASLLNRLKQDLAEDRVPTDPAPLDPDDHSVQVHAAHSRTRQVEVLREAVLGLLAADPTLEPRDILVMCPDVEAFAPLVAAAFSLGDAVDPPDGTRTSAHPAARLRVRVADRALRQTNALLDVLSQLLDLGTARITASQVLDLAGRAAVRQRFGFDDDDLERLRDWLVGAGIRWGLDPEHRGLWQLGDIRQGTWRAGLDRLLLGVALESDLTGLGDVVAMDDVDSADIELAGRLAELIDRLAVAQRLMSGRQTAAEWTAGLEAAVLSLADTTTDTAWQLAQLHSELADLAETAGSSTFGLADLRTLLAETLAGRPTRASFRTGTLTVCTLVPMRSVPHRVVCLLGLDDGTFPRQSIRDGDDVLARDPWVGERDPRSEDRQLFLDAVSAAEEHLLITYSGADDRIGSSIPPAVPLGELLDALDRTATAPDGRRVRDLVTVRHPLQPFDPRNFTPGALGTTRPFSFDRLGLDGSRAASGPRRPPEPFLADPLPAPPPADIDLADLQRLLQHPARGFLRQRLQVAATRAEDEPDDALPVELDALERWAVGERLLTERLAGLEPAQCIDVELRRGLLPPGPLGLALLRTVGSEVETVVVASAEERLQPAESHDVDVVLPDGTRLTGTVGGVRGDALLSVTYSRLSARHRLSAWVNLLALSASRPEQSWRSVAVGRDRNGALRSKLGPVPPDQARTALLELIGLYRSGLRSALPLPLKAGAAYADQRARGRRIPAARTAAENAWLDGLFPGEQSDAEHVLLHGPAAGLAVLTAAAPEPDEQGSGWADDEEDRFGRLARRLWGRLLAAERQERR